MKREPMEFQFTATIVGNIKAPSSEEARELAEQQIMDKLRRGEHIKIKLEHIPEY